MRRSLFSLLLVLGNNEGRLWTAAKIHSHTAAAARSQHFLARSESHTHSLPVSTRGLSSRFLPYMATELLWSRRVCMCVYADINHDPILLC